MKVLRESDRLYPYPRGWYAIDTSRELKPGQVRRTGFMGGEIVYYRTASGRPVVMDAYCRHMGAHLGYGGFVDGERIVCPFHHFAYGPTGAFESAPRLERCLKLKMKTYPVDEKWGYLMVWWDPDGGAPLFEVPARVDTTEWSYPLVQTVEIPVHPVDVGENGADIRHFWTLHHNTFEMKRFGAVDEHHWRTYYEGRILDESAGLDFYHRIAVGEMDVRFYALGLLTVEVKLPKLGMAFHYMVSPVPIDEHRTKLLIGVNMRRWIDVKATPLDRYLPFLRGRIPLFGVDRLVHLWRKDFLRTQLEDAEIWANKLYLSKPGYMDPAVIDFRRWARGLVAMRDGQAVERPNEDRSQHTQAEG